MEIKYYKVNRKLYCTEKRGYINQSQLLDYVKQNKQFIVTVEGRDITAIILNKARVDRDFKLAMDNVGVVE